MLYRIIGAVVIAVGVTLGCLLLALVLGILNVAVAGAVGAFLQTYAAAIGVLCGLWYFATGNTWPRRI